MDTNRWLGHRHYVAREAATAGHLLDAARGRNPLSVRLIGQVVRRVPDPRSNGSVVEAA